MLQVIQNNPFRILGIGSNASPQEIGKRYNQLRMAETDEVIDLSGLLGKVNRTDESMLEAFKLLQDSNIRISYAQFWFMRNNAADDLAFNNVNANNIGLALSVWPKQKSVIALRNSLMALIFCKLRLLRMVCIKLTKYLLGK